MGGTPSAAGGVWRSVNAGHNFTPVTIPAVGAARRRRVRVGEHDCVAAAAAGGRGGDVERRPVVDEIFGTGADRDVRRWSATKCVGTDHSKLYWSSDAGRTWTAASQPANQGWDGINPSPFCASVTVCLAGTGMTPDTSAPYILRSTDAGHHWKLIDESNNFFEFSFDQVRCQTTSRCLGLQLVDEVGEPGLDDYHAAWTPDGGVHSGGRRTRRTSSRRPRLRALPSAASPRAPTSRT